MLSHYLKLWADPYGEIRGEVKGGAVVLPYKRLYVTSQYTIEEIFEDPLVRLALNRRFIFW